MLPPALRNQLVDTLLLVPNMDSRAQRGTLLMNLPQNIRFGLSRDDAPVTDWMLVIEQLDNLGRLDSGERPLVGVVELAVRRVEGSAAARQLKDVKRDLEQHYGPADTQAKSMAAPAAPPALVQKTVPEAIIFGDERVGFAFVKRAVDVAGSVARLAVPFLVGGKQYHLPSLGTGWLLTPGLLITNHHVLYPRLEGAPPCTPAFLKPGGAKARAWFDYLEEGGARDEHELGDIVCADSDLDFAILRIPTAATRKPLVLSATQPALLPGDRLNIVQHSDGGPMTYAIRSNHYVGAADPPNAHLLRYLTDTEGGASGSPVLDDTWRVVALHHAYTEVPPQKHHGQVIYVNNEGIEIHAILAKLPATLRAEIQAAQPENGWKTDVDS